MPKKYLPVKASKKRCFLLFIVFLCLYLMDNLPVASLIGYRLYSNYLKPALWIGLALMIIGKFPKIQPVAKLRLRNGFILWAFSLGFIHVFALIGGGFVDGFGKSPYDHSLIGMLLNVFMVGSVLIGRELFRSYVINSIAKKENYLVFVLISLLMTACNFAINKYTGLNGAENIVIFGARFFVPEFSRNLMATYLAFLGGVVPSVMYMGILEAFHWLSPVLPDLKWITTALIGILCPVFSLMVIQNIYLKESKLLKRKDRKEDSPLSWMSTSLVSIAVIWFAVGVFPIYPSVIATGSMEPMIKPGDVILVKKTVDKENLNIGDVIQFRRENILISHRIIEIVEFDKGKGYRTKGDNNSSMDTDIVKVEQIKGKVIKVVPKIGWPTLLIKSKNEIPLDEIEF